MKIAKNTVVSLAYQVRTKDGVLVDEATTVAPLEYLQGAGNLLQELENALEGHQVGDKFDVELINAYGDFNDALVQNVPRDVFVGVDELEVGMRFFADTDHGALPVEITAIDGDTVTIDGNHMLAGQDLKFNVEVLAIREATEEEIAHGHIHSEHGHEHGHGGCGCGGHDHEDEEDSGCCGGGHGSCGCH
ncbi:MULTISPECIES: peptidylprolyl isomerase [unclassified Gilliamella]|uniref:peptidylprolyl isomerase n=1 Tax=unclassified Gilliamella TaxID=2685620 RepID=UPI00226A272B|nr:MULTISPECIES: peptidylprolyl isomerase [unclassified Gilliamella]MCX8577918.1 peptidylprolyl isomerase [Gilliamella sp. B2717]MCX8587790.1 peptidylprolyl isomerase [Gilliamella sp. B3801]MCX8591598.1 peptidylprolyl isomerase [Gilliamella sp. B3804]